MYVDYINLINGSILIGLILLAVYFVVMNMRTFLLPENVGHVVAFGSDGEADNVLGIYKDCNSCQISENSGRLAFPIKIKLDDKSVVDAEISPCSLCMDKVKVGDRVGVTTVGSRCIAQKLGKFTIRHNSD